MADEHKLEEKQAEVLEDFKGSVPEQRTAKSSFISKFGFDAWVALVARSRGYKK